MSRGISFIWCSSFDSCGLRITCAKVRQALRGSTTWQSLEERFNPHRCAMHGAHIMLPSFDPRLLYIILCAPLQSKRMREQASQSRVEGLRHFKAIGTSVCLYKRGTLKILANKALKEVYNSKKQRVESSNSARSERSVRGPVQCLHHPKRFSLRLKHSTKMQHQKK